MNEDGPLDLIVMYGDCELYGQCACGTMLGQPIKPNQSLDVLGRRWERHAMTACSGIIAKGDVS